MPEKTTIWIKRFLCWTGGLLFVLNTYAVPEYTLRKYRVENGLSHNTTYCALQDSSGLIWIGTGNGLNCFDGNAFRVYYIHHSMINTNRILSLAERDAHTLVVGTNSGICLYDKRKGELEPLPLTTEYGVSISCEVSRIVKDPAGKIWIATLGQGFFIWDPSTGQLTQNSSYSSFIVDLGMENDRVYIATLENGWAAFHLDGRLKYQRTFAPAESAGTSALSALSVSGGTVWLGSANGDIQACRASDGSAKAYFSLPTCRQEAVHCFRTLESGCLLIGSSDGAYWLDPYKKSIRSADHLTGERVGNNHLNAIFRDAEKGLWLLTEQDGAYYLAWHTHHFERFAYDRPTEAGKGENIIGPLCEDQQGGVWVGTRYGLWRLGENESVLRQVAVPANGDLQIEVTALLPSRTKLWIGTNGNGLAVMDIPSGKVRWYRHSQQMPNTIGSDVIRALYQTREGEVYVGTNWGLSRYMPQTDDFLTVPTVGMMVEVSDLHEDAQGYLWVATANSGVFRCYLKTGEWKHFQASSEEKGLSIHSVIALLEGHDGKMWFATDGGGLCWYDRETEEFFRLGAGTKVPIPNVIHAVEEDAGGDLWVSSYWGLMRIAPSDLSFSVYTVSDGLQSNQFCPRSSLLTRQGWLFFGSIDGLNACRPEQFWQNRQIPPVVITDLNFPYTDDLAFARRLKGGNGPLIESEQIRLPWNNNSFGISFVSLSYSDPSRNRYSYILHGIDREWIKSTEHTTAYYTDLPPGKYEFEVKGSNNDGVWNEESCRLSIVITPPWWLSGWAYAMYIGIGGLFVYFLAWKWNQWVKRKYQRRMEQFRIMQEKETYRSKVGFFVNLVHEIRTPLSLIRLPLEQLSDRRHPGEREEQMYLETIRSNVDYLLGVTNELLDFQKMENEGLKVSLQPCDIVQLVRRIASQFAENLRLKGKELEVKLPEEGVLVVTDAGKVSKVAVNFLSNAMKYARKRIGLELTFDEKMFHLSVSDDGPGIDPEERTRVFTAFYQINNDSQMPGTGIGLAFSRSLAEGLKGTLQLTESRWGGSCFTLSLPLGDAGSIGSDETGPSTLETGSLPESPAGKDRKFTVLMVEDNRDLLTMTTALLSKWFVVSKAENGREALDRLEREMPDVIVSDVMMAVMDGLELCRQLKSRIEWSHIPLILLTAKTSLDAKTEGAECGADVYVEKPFTIRQLKAQIENLLQLRSACYKVMQQLNLDAKESPATVAPGLSQRDYEWIGRIKDVIEQRMAEPDFSIDVLADALSMSRSNFYRKIKALSGMAPNDYLKVVRLNRAAELLRQGYRTTEVFELIGFSSASYFSKCFKEQFGVLPKDFLSQQPGG